MNTEPLPIFKEAGGKSAAVRQLAPFTTLTVMKSEAGWVLVAKDGQLLGYVLANKLHKLQ